MWSPVAFGFIRKLAAVQSSFMQGMSGMRGMRDLSHEERLINKSYYQREYDITYHISMSLTLLRTSLFVGKED